MLSELKSCIGKYKSMDDQIRDLNAHLTKMREERKILELEIGDILKLPEFSTFNKLKIEEDGSTIKVQRPNEWLKPWSLSQRELSDLIDQYFQSTNSPTSEGCKAFIVERRKRNLVATEFSITRTLPSE